MPFNFAVRQNHSRLVREQEIHCALKKCWPWVRDLFFLLSGTHACLLKRITTSFKICDLSTSWIAAIVSNFFIFVE